MAEKFNFNESMETIARKTRSTRVLRYFPNSDLRCAQDGLRLVAKEEGVDPWKLSPGEFLVFSNTKQTMLKIFAPGNVLASVKHPLGHRIDLNMVRYIPRFFNGTEFKMEAALKEMVVEKLKKAS